MSNETDQLPEVVRQSIENGQAALLPDEIGDRGVAHLLPPGWTLAITEADKFEDMPRLVRTTQKVVGVESLARYIEPHKSDATRGYVRDVYGSGEAMLTRDTDLVTVVLDDNLPGNEPNTTAHRSVFVLRPTAAARRWGAAFQADRLSQDQLLDLVVDGVPEIATPDAAVLRDLVENLHAIRSSEVSSVIRTGGQGSIELKENVGLSTGSSNRVPFPEEMTIVLAPFAGIDHVLTLKVKVAPEVIGNGVWFALSAPDLDEAIAVIVQALAGEVTDATGLDLVWTP